MTELSPEYTFLEAEPVERDLEQTRQQMLAAINHTRDWRIGQGFDFTYAGETHRIQSRQSDRENVLGLAFRAAQTDLIEGDFRWLNPEVDFQFIAEDNSTFPLDAPGMLTLYATGLTFKSVQTIYARAAKNTILACATLADIDAEIQGQLENWP